MTIWSSNRSDLNIWSAQEEVAIPIGVRIDNNPYSQYIKSHLRNTNITVYLQTFILTMFKLSKGNILLKSFDILYK